MNNKKLRVTPFISLCKAGAIAVALFFAANLTFAQSEFPIGTWMGNSSTDYWENDGDTTILAQIAAGGFNFLVHKSPAVLN